MQPAARVSDMHVCPMVNGVVPHVGGPILPPGCPTVLIGFMPAARVGDMATCVGPPDTILPPGSPTVLIGNMPAARMGDMTSHGGSIVLGCPTVLIGASGSGGGGGGGGGGAPGAAGSSAGASGSSSGGGSGGGAAPASPQAGAMGAARAAGLPFCAVCNQPGDPPPQAEVTHSITITSLEAEHFVPEVETLGINYDITGPIDQVNGVKLIVTLANDESRVLLERALPGPFAASGTYDWNGSVSVGGFINLKNAPYKVRLVLTASSGEHRSNTKTVGIELEAVEIEVSAHDSLHLSARDKPIIEHVKDGVENDGGKGIVVMKSPIFKISSPEMNDASSFVQYRNAWQKGVPIPCLAKVWLKGKDDTRKTSSNALNGSKLLWDVKPDNDADYEAMLDSLNLHATGKQRVMQVSAYHKDDTNPAGRTAHKHFGGMRCRTADRVGISYWAALNSDWNFKKPAQREWCAYTKFKHQADPEAVSGIKFVGGRMAGDTHSVTAYLDIDGSLDATQDATLSGAPAKQKSNAMKFVNWRRIEIVKNYKIGAATTELNLTALRDEYTKASMTIEPKAGVVVEDIQARWRTEYQRVINAMAANSDFIRDAALPDPGLYPVKYRDHADYKSRMDRQTNVFGRAWNRVRRFFGGDSIEDYRQECDLNSYRIYSRVARGFPLTNNGLTFFKFGATGSHNQWHGSYTAGIAPSIRGYSGRNKAAFFVFKPDDGSQVLVHEVGHLIFLAHAPGHWTPGRNPAGYQPNAHADNQWCVMSYHGSHPSELCGTCILKLSGWNYTKINKDGTVT